LSFSYLALSPPYTFLSSTYLLRHLSLSAPTLLLSLVNPLKLTLISLFLNISYLDSPSYICDPPSIFTFNDVGLFTLYWELVSWHRFLPWEHVQRGELLLITIWDDPSRSLLWGIDSGDHNHYSTSWTLCLRTRLDCSKPIPEPELSQLLSYQRGQREFIRVPILLVCLLLYISNGLCTYYSMLPTKWCVTWHVTLLLLLSHGVIYTFPCYK